MVWCNYDDSDDSGNNVEQFVGPVNQGQWSTAWSLTLFLCLVDVSAVNVALASVLIQFFGHEISSYKADETCI